VRPPSPITAPADAIVMSVSTIVVATNAQLLRRLQLRRDPATAQPALLPTA